MCNNSPNLSVFSSFSLKIIALIAMTIDHVALLLFEIPAIAAAEIPLHTIGRIAAPLFLFVAVESARHTSNRIRYIVRLYAANLICAIVVVISNTLFSNYIGEHSAGNIFTTLMYTVVFIHCIEEIKASLQNRDRKRLLICLLGVLIIFLVQIIISFYVVDNRGIDTSQSELTILLALFPRVLVVEYTPLFILLGLAWYWFPGKIQRILALLVWSFLARYPLGLDVWVFVSYFGAQQQWMFLAAPFIALYSGTKGKGLKYFFYLYYIAHPYVLYVVSAILGK
jgi:hypothetical protein